MMYIPTASRSYSHTLQTVLANAVKPAENTVSIQHVTFEENEFFQNTVQQLLGQSISESSLAADIIT